MKKDAPPEAAQPCFIPPARAPAPHRTTRSLASLRIWWCVPMQLLDKLAHLFPDSSRTTLRQMLQHGRVRVNGEVEKDAKRNVGAEDVVDVTDKKAARLLPPALTLLHEDRDVLVVVKANGLLTVATERERDTTAQAYLNHYLG